MPGSEESMELRIMISETKTNWIELSVIDKDHELHEYMKFMTIETYIYNEGYIPEIRDHFMRQTAQQAKEFSEWKKQVLTLKKSWFSEPQNYCLPTVFNHAPLIFTKKNLVICLGEIDTDKLPKLYWVNSAEETGDEV